MVSLDTAALRRWVLGLPGAFLANLERLNALDTLAGDGDHGTTMLRGLNAAAQAVRLLEGETAGATLHAAGAAMRKAAGGASGPLFSSLFLEFAKVTGESGLDLDGFVRGLESSVSTVARLGKAEPGDRTMLDALGPAAAAARASSGLEQALEQALNAARDGVDATVSMVARKGRARFVNAGVVNGMDAGATSVVLMLEGLLEAAANQKMEGA